MKKTLLALTTALTLPATAALADAPNIQFYGGLQVGGTHATVDMTTDSTVNPLAPNPTRTFKNTTHNKFFLGGVFAGFRVFFGDFFTGLEVEGNWDGMNIKKLVREARVNDNWRLELQRRYQIIPSATLGWKMTEKAALYAKFGAGISKFAFTEGRTQGSQLTRERTIIHFVPAIGAEYELHKNAALRLEVSGEVAGRYIKGDSQGSPNIYQFTKARYRAASVKFGVLVKV